MPTLGQQLKALRVKKGMTQEQLATKLNTTKAAISRYERDQRQPRLEQISEIAQILEANPNELFDLFINTDEVQDKDGDKGMTYFNALFKWAQTVTSGAPQGISGEKCEDAFSSENSPLDFYDLEENEVIQKLVDVFSKLDRYWQKEVIEDAEMYLEWQESREEKKKKLKQEVE